MSAAPQSTAELRHEQPEATGLVRLLLDHLGRSRNALVAVVTGYIWRTVA